MNSETINRSIRKQQKVIEEMRLASFEVFQEIMSTYVGVVLARAYPIGDTLIQEIEGKTGDSLTIMDKESIVGMIATGVWAEISNNLQNQIVQQAISEEIPN